MTDKVTLTNLANLQNEVTAVTAINSNNVAITAAMDNTLSRDGTTPNQMNATLDMNNQDIINLPSPATLNSPARLIDVTTNPTVVVPPTGTSGSTVPFLNGNNTWSGTNSFTAATTLANTTISGTLSLPANTVTNSNLAQMAANTLKGNNTAGLANAADLTTAQVITMLGINTGFLIQPQGRLTLTTGTAVMTSDVVSATTIFYTPAVGQFCPIFNGSVFTVTDLGGELSQTTSDTTKSPAAMTTNSNYDIFVWNDSGTFRATRGPVWSSSVARGTGAGTTELILQKGVFLNANAITNGPAAQRGTYVGTVRSNGTSTVDMKFGTFAAGGGAANIGVWNLYNQVYISCDVRDTTASWTYTSSTAQPTNASTNNRVSFVSGLAINPIAVFTTESANTAAASNHQILCGPGLDVTASTDIIGAFSTGSANSYQVSIDATAAYKPQLGFHFIQSTERSDGTHVATFNGSGIFQSLQVSMFA